MSVKLNENNHPCIELDGKLSICINRAAYEADKQLRVQQDLPEETAKALAEFRRLAEKTPNLNVVVDQSNWTAMLYLHCYNNDAEKAFALMDYSYRLAYKERDLCPPFSQVRRVFEEGLIRYLPKSDDDGSIIYIVEMGRRWNPSQISLPELIGAMRLGGFGVMLNPEAQQHGCKMIIDVDGLGMSHIAHFTPRCCTFLFELLERCTPIVTKGLHIVNSSMIYNVLFAVLKPFMSKELREKNFIHGRNWKSLAKHINPSVLPEKYGGTLGAPDCDGKLMAEFMQHYEGYFEEYISYGYTDKPDPK